ncbi:unnamed protein product [Phytophthora fragariaefolia]|uniref:Unnamed protein product n=1 Tax=Phytophthora fragariaefolia TaxID=1490495 RepID=A0A9W7D231_9STRA|nr:unnamed protein product [Phytophthora fragariaefolia]
MEHSTQGTVSGGVVGSLHGHSLPPPDTPQQGSPRTSHGPYPSTSSAHLGKRPAPAQSSSEKRKNRIQNADSKIDDLSLSLVELPNTSILMCWFHVTQNVWNIHERKRLEIVIQRVYLRICMICTTLANTIFHPLKVEFLSKWIQFPIGSPARKLTDHIIKMWISNERFSHWQAFYTPGGYAATNNPLEQYHIKLKCQCPGPSNPSELIKNWMGRELHITTESDFKSRIPPVGSVAADLYRVKEHRLELTAAEKRDFTNSIKSVNSRRMQTQGMPSGGWIVDTRSKSCSCLFFCKHSMCFHVVRACIAGGVACPGVSIRSRQFVRPNHTDTAEYPDDFSDAESTGAENDAISSSPVPSIASLASTGSLPEDDHEYQAVPPTHTEVVLPQPQDGLNTDNVRPGSRRSLHKKKSTSYRIASSTSKTYEALRSTGNRLRIV